MKQFLLLLISGIFLLACEKRGNTRILKGQILDIDSRNPIAGAKVFATTFLASDPYMIDSSISDAAGQVSFSFNDSYPRTIYRAEKTSYIWVSVVPPRGWSQNNNRIDTVYLARPSSVSLTTHKTSNYLVDDSLFIGVSGIFWGAPFQVPAYLIKEKANSPDKVYNLQSYYSTWSTKLYFNWEIKRAGTIISSSSDSADLIQYGTRSVLLNY